MDISHEELVELVREAVLRPILAELEKRGVQQEWFSIRQAAKYCGLSEDHVRRAVTTAMLSCSNVGSNDRPTYRISRRDLEEWMEVRKHGAIPSPKKKGKRKLPLSPYFKSPSE